ncbi:MAG: hypothetical protein WBD99_12310 [Thermodesulfobacteriota bacterium]
MSRLKIVLSIFAVSAFLALVVGISQAQAGVAPAPVDCGAIVCDIDCPGGGADCFGTDGDDIICGSDDAESIFAGKGDDDVCAGDGNDVVHGGFGDDAINGEDGDDTIQGGWGDDNMAGGAGDDTILAGRCDDAVDGGEGSEVAGDTCLGGWGLDIFTADSCENEDQGQPDQDNHANCM